MNDGDDNMNNVETSFFGSQTSPTTEQKFKPLKDLTLTDNFLFGYIFRKPKNFERVVSLLLGREVEVVNDTYLDDEVSANNKRGYRSVRFDIMFKDTKQIIDLEMQNAKSLQNPLPKRASFYTSVLNRRSMRSGTPYITKLDTYVIFLCNFDPFGLGDYKYCAKYECIAKFFKQER